MRRAVLRSHIAALAARRASAFDAHRRARALALALFATALACHGGPPPPADLDTQNESCRFCRMAIYSQKTAAQLVAPGEEPLFFDDLGCLRDYLAGGAEIPRGAIAYVADHRSKDWVPAAAALYTRQPRLETPMGSHVIAHLDAARRDADPDAAGGERLTANEVFGATGPPAGSR